MNHIENLGKRALCFISATVNRRWVLPRIKCRRSPDAALVHSRQAAAATGNAARQVVIDADWGRNAEVLDRQHNKPQTKQAIRHRQTGTRRRSLVVVASHRAGAASAMVAQLRRWRSQPLVFRGSRPARFDGYRVSMWSRSVTRFKRRTPSAQYAGRVQTPDGLYAVRRTRQFGGRPIRRQRIQVKVNSVRPSCRKSASASALALTAVRRRTGRSIRKSDTASAPPTTPAASKYSSCVTTNNAAVTDQITNGKLPQTSHTFR